MSQNYPSYSSTGEGEYRRRRKRRGPRGGGGTAVAARSTMRRMAPVGPAQVAEALGVPTEEPVSEVTQKSQVQSAEERHREASEDPAATPRAPVITIMGHVD